MARDPQEVVSAARRPALERAGDDRLALIFACAHPALAIDERVALTLQAVAGLTATEIGRALLVGRQAMAQRLVRAKRRLRTTGVGFEVPADHELSERLAAVLAVVYLLFNEGYAATEGDRLLRAPLAAEAIRLGKLLAALMPDEPEGLGLAALMLLHDARRTARVDRAGDVVLLEDQDRTRWDREAIRQGRHLLDRALRQRRPGPYQAQAAIAALHAEAPTAAATDWPQIAALYEELRELAPGPVTDLNHAVAVAMAGGPEQGLALLEAIEGLERHHLFHATRADLLRRQGQRAAARVAYQEALRHVANAAERRFLERRLSELD